jgi:hypothetical protein
MDKISGTFSIEDGMLYLSLADGRKFTLSFLKRHLAIHDVSWMDYFRGQTDALNKEQLLAIQHSEIPYGDETIDKICLFIDVAGIPPKKP